jgi:hypothetical protein
MGRYLCCRIFVRVAFFVFPTGADAPLKLEALHKNREAKNRRGQMFHLQHEVSAAYRCSVTSFSLTVDQVIESTETSDQSDIDGPTDFMI